MAQPVAKSLRNLIDLDGNLKSKRVLLVSASLLLIGIVLSGAEVTEANTFLFKVIFSNQEGIPFLLLLSIAFLMMRYYSYALGYHKEIYRLWTGDLLRNGLLYSHNPFSDEANGVVIDLLPKGLDLEEIEHSQGHLSWEFEYGLRFAFCSQHSLQLD